MFVRLCICVAIVCYCMPLSFSLECPTPFPYFSEHLCQWIGVVCVLCRCRFCFFQSCGPFVFVDPVCFFQIFYAILNVFVDPALQFFLYQPDNFVTYLNSGVRCAMKVSKLWSTMVDFLNNMVL